MGIVLCFLIIYIYIYMYTYIYTCLFLSLLLRFGALKPMGACLVPTRLFFRSRSLLVSLSFSLSISLSVFIHICEYRYIYIYMWLVQTGSIWQVSCNSHSTSNSLSNRSNDQSACRTSPSSIQTNPTDPDNTNHMCIVKRNFRPHTHAHLSCSMCMAPGVWTLSFSVRRIALWFLLHRVAL